MKLIYAGDKYVFVCSFEHKDIAKNNGFKWDATLRRWYTTEPDKALRLMQYADEDCHVRLAALKTKLQKAVVDSRAESTSFRFDGMLCEPRPFQWAGIEYGVNNGNVLIGDDMGLGKSCQALGIVFHKKAFPCLIVCPAMLKINWSREIVKFLPIAETQIMQLSGTQPEPLLMSMAKFVIINYDVLIYRQTKTERLAAKAEAIVSGKKPKRGPSAGPWVSALKEMGFQSIIIDESQNLCNKSKRTDAVTELAKDMPIKLLLSGTPMANKPIDLVSQLTILGRIDEFGGSWKFIQRYTNPVKTGFGYDFSGASNLGELQKKLRAGIMIRRLKSEVLKELPPKQRQVIEVPSDRFHDLIAAENVAWENHQIGIVELRAAVELAKACDSDDDYHKAVEALKDGVTASFAEMAKLRHQTALAKVPMMVEHLTNMGDSKLIVGAHHLDVLHQLADAFKDSHAFVSGEEPNNVKRMAEVDRFQTDPKCTKFFGQIRAAGVGLNLTAASIVVFAEQEWTPYRVTQFEDRAHRIGQHDCVIVQHFVLEGSLDARMAKVVVGKQQIIDKALDRQDAIEALDIPVAPIEEAATQAATRKRIAVDAEKITPQLQEAIHSCMRMLAGTDSDFASIRNDIGFSKYDAKIGHSLASAPSLSPKQAALACRLVVKYARQLPVDVVAQCKEIIRIKRKDTDEEATAPAS